MCDMLVLRQQYSSYEFDRLLNDKTDLWPKDRQLGVLYILQQQIVK
jgi:hypothetical protein